MLSMIGPLSFGDGRLMAILVIFLSITLVVMAVPLKFSVVAFFDRVVEIGSGMCLAVVLHLFITLEFHRLPVLQLKHIGGILQILVLDQNALERLGLEPKGGAT